MYNDPLRQLLKLLNLSRFNRLLYRRCLKLSLNWTVHRYLWRGQALYIRSLFEANKDVTERRQQRVSPFGIYVVRGSALAI